MVIPQSYANFRGSHIPLIFHRFFSACGGPAGGAAWEAASETGFKGHNGDFMRTEPTKKMGDID
jgi:hypothetical protein